jgi:hypothetical protein
VQGGQLQQQTDVLQQQTDVLPLSRAEGGAQSVTKVVLGRALPPLSPNVLRQCLLKDTGNTVLFKTQLAL